MAAAFVLSASGTATVTVATATERPSPQPPPPVAAPPAPAPPEHAPQELALPPSEPVTIDVPAIGVHSVLQQVGLTPEHTMEVPTGPHYNDAAWYRHSPTPGAPGPAVIVGHVDSAAEGPSVFFDLEDLRQGDEVLVTRADGLVAVFRVDAVDRYPKDDFPTALVYGDTDRAVLRLITCGGVFDPSARHYLDNVVVFATLVRSQ
ncbi:MAG TPA: class F sortase [Egibacteraceae bacterium]|nr:class F sortase [Egibacteraceae bacterium]